MTEEQADTVFTGPSSGRLRHLTAGAGISPATASK